jgi:hypothetical protein
MEFSASPFGIFIFYQMGYVNGIFTDHPHWVPGAAKSRLDSPYRIRVVTPRGNP